MPIDYEHCPTCGAEDELCGRNDMDGWKEDGFIQLGNGERWPYPGDDARSDFADYGPAWGGPAYEFTYYECGGLCETIWDAKNKRYYTVQTGCDKVVPLEH